MVRNKVTTFAIESMSYDLVSINYDKIKSFVVDDKGMIFDCPLKLKQFESLNELIKYALVLNSINYQFWDVVDGKYIRYTHDGKIGALAMMSSFENFWAEMKRENFDADVLSIQFIEKFFGNIPDIDGRLLLLTEMFNIDKLENSAKLIEHRIDELNVDVAIFLSLFFPISYNEPFYKKIQLALSEISMAMGKVNNGFTVFADYQLPKVLVGMGIIELSHTLEAKIYNMELLEEDSPEETSIRAVTIIACEMICELTGISKTNLDYYLWLKRNDYPNPFHLTKTRRY